jgi:hypothetical protein
MSIGSTAEPLYVLIRRMKSSTSSHPVAALLTLALSASCGSSGTSGTPGPVGNVVVKDANNYSSTSSLMIPVVETMAGADLSISWDGITQDLLCHTAGTIDNVAFLRIGNMTQANVEDKLAKGQLTSTEVTTYREFNTKGATSTMLSDFSFGQPKLVPMTDYVVAAGTQYLLLFTHGTTLGVGAQSMVFLSPSATSANVTVAAPNPCGTTNFLSFSATFGTDLSIPAAGPWKIDWSQVTTDNFGQKLDFSMTIIDKVEVGFFQGKQPSDIQADFLNVEQDATALYTYAIPAGQKFVDLSSTPTIGGTFPGFGDTSGTYAVAALCSSCQVPAPVVFSILQPQ